MSVELRRRVMSVFQLNGFRIGVTACDFLVETLSPLPSNEREEWLDKITDYIHKQLLDSPQIEKPLIEAAIIDSFRNANDKDEEVLHVISAFEVPTFSYNVERKKFWLNTNHKPELYASAASKGKLFHDRYTILYQRTLRNKLFHGAANDTSQFKLRRVEFLLSSTTKKNNVVLLGLLTQLKEGKFFLEDPSGIVQLDLSRTSYHDGLFADSCFVLAEGSFLDGIMTVDAMGLPPRENSEVSRIYFGTSNTFGGPNKESVRNNERLRNLETKRSDAMLVFISDCHLDQAKVMEKLGVLFEGYDSSPPTAFILMGDFLSQRSSPFSLRDRFKALGELIGQSPNLARRSKFIIIPGPNDSPSPHILPRPELPHLLISGMTQVNVILATNPCRIQYCTQEIVVVREDLVTKLCRNSVHFPSLKNIGIHFAKTIISQAHIAPLSLNVCPVYWEFDAALQLYPCPDLIVVADRQSAFSAEYNNCRVINPGPFSKGGFVFQVYYPATKEVEDCVIPEKTT